MLSWFKLNYLKIRQDSLIFKPYKKSIDPLRTPTIYGLDRVVSADIQTEDGVYIHLWRRNVSDEEKPFFVVFHGNTGHWGDVGAPDREDEEPYERNYRIGLLKEIDATGCGFLAVCLRGFGDSQKVKPSEDGFIIDAKAVIKYVTEKMRVSNKNVIILGESLGASVGFIMAELMTENKTPPALIATVAAFSSMKWKVLEMHPDLNEEKLEAGLKHKFDSEKRLENLHEDTHIYLTHPAEDKTTHKSHSKKLADIAKASGLKVTHKEIKGAGHITWNPKEVVSDVIKVYSKHVESSKKKRKK